MTKTIGLQLIVYSLLLGGLSYLVHHLAPALARSTLITGLAGSALCVVWGVRAVLGKTGKALPVLTLIPVNFVMLSQTVTVWLKGSGDVTGRRIAAVMIALLLVLSVGMLMRIAYAGVAFGVQAVDSTGGRRERPPSAGKANVQTNAAKGL